MRRTALLGIGALACSYPGRSGDVSAPVVASTEMSRLYDPTVRGARLVPATIDASTAVPDAMGTLRGVVMGIRYLAGPGQSVQTSSERLDDTSETVPLPSRFGGGFLFVVGDSVLRADTWLGHVRPFYRATKARPTLFVGLDRVYVRWGNGTHSAFDPLSGHPLDLGPWPADPFVGAYAALDGWCAFALTDLQGVVVTRDAGRTWTRVDLPIHAERFVAVRRDSEHGGWATVAPGGNAEAVVASDRGDASGAPGSVHCVLVTTALEVVPFASCDEIQPDSRGELEPRRTEERSALRGAVEDGWPLHDGTALVAEAGRLSRVSLRDGTIVSSVEEAFDASLGRCHALSLARPDAPTTVGFVCGEREGRTVLLSKEAGTRGLTSIRSFPTPRVVQASAGSWLVHGGCAEVTPTASRYCVGTPTLGGASYRWTTHEVTDEVTAVGLSHEGHLVALYAPNDLEGARLVLYPLFPEEGAPTAVPLRVSELSERMRRVLKRGAWVGGLTTNGELGLDGWVAADSTVVGVAIGLDGTVRTGPWVGDLGSPFVAGEYGLGWTRSHRGYETIDGGRTWAQFAAPTPLAPSTVRACGPVGCSADGWLRIGWGAPVLEPSRPPEGAPLSTGRPPSLALSCQLAEKTAARRDLAEASRQPREGAHVDHGELSVSEELHPLDGALPPALYGSIRAWGPSTGEWIGRGHWVAAWRSPFAATSSSWSTTGPAPAPFADAATATLALSGHASSASVTVSTDASHALVVRRASGKPPELAGLDAGGRVWPIVRDDGQPWPSVEAALRIGGDWYIAVAAEPHRAAIDILRADARGAKRLARVTRHLGEPALGQVRLAHGVDGNLLGLVVEGEPLPDRNVPRRWVVPIDLDTGVVGAAESLGAADLADRDSVGPCRGGAAGAWLLDATWPNAEVTLTISGGEPVALRQAYARLRISSDRVCVEGLAGEARLSVASSSGAEPQPRPSSSREIPVVLTGGPTPVELRCCAGPK